MLESKHGGRSENRHLLVIHDGFKCRAHGHFGLAITDVAAEEAVHRLAAVHSALDVAFGRGVLGGVRPIGKVLGSPPEAVSLGANTQAPGRVFTRAHSNYNATP